MDARPAQVAGTDLAVAGVAKRFAATQVLHDVDFSVPSGQAAALIGANGAGKSTLLRCCLRLIEPDAGTIRLLGHDMRGIDPAGLYALRAEVGFVFQKHNLVGRLSALSNVLHGAIGPTGFACAWFQSLAPSALREEAMACLERVGLATIADRRADRLSGGQSRRAAMARTLIEPILSLDPAVGEEVMALFPDLIRRQGLTLLFTSHDLAHAIAFADRVIALRAGRIVLDAPTATLDVAPLRALQD